MTGVGIVEFYGNKNWALPMQSAANKVTIDWAIRPDGSRGWHRAVSGDRGSVLRTEKCHGALPPHSSSSRMPVSNASTQGFEELLRRIADEKINVSTALIGANSRTVLT